MKIDLDYYQKILEVFVESEYAVIELGEVIEAVGCFDEKFLYHYMRLAENGLVSSSEMTSGTLGDVGLIQDCGDFFPVRSKLIRLTQAGDDFANSLNNKEVLEKLKAEFKDAPFKAIFDGGQKILHHIIKKKVDTLLQDSGETNS
ncbi:DUF2513 domain-containing protein [Pseudoalteromonas obscura]|uniref:DUF2513 domain-containing protein n=1 Tax=Pseudoalteromonas obscura TaxID=3048491 RepID=A0ABT7ESC8_9GAMM|nr:DUF2513 domain-containing protein [Pseudoalteromonas sp. P94(2023)]MDK2597932.1 DUF2513 domain-containing protein [Pseudoalteromonas sp. P94(2023)]